MAMNEMIYTVRMATAEDARELARLRWEFRVEEQVRQTREEFIDACEEWLIEALNAGNWVVAVVESESSSLGGCIYLQCVEKVPVPGELRRAWGYVTNSYVSPELRGAGIGGKLLDILCDAGRERMLEFLIVWPSKKAVPFYQRAGFLEVSNKYTGPDDEPPLEMNL